VNKTELIARVAEKTSLTKKAAGDAVEAVLDTISEALASGEKVTIVGFGTFEVRDRAARRGVNPATGEAIEIPASRVPAFKAGKSLKEKVSAK
jgi:Bacterial nucleoid DNA-binding protein